MTSEEGGLRAADRIAERVSGTLRYTVDVDLPGMAHAALARSPLPAARITAIATDRAAAMPGVIRVVTGRDLGSLGLTDHRFGTIKADQPILPEDQVRYVGEPVAAVIATSADRARAAASMIELTLEPLAAVFDQDDALAPGAPLVHDAAPGNELGRAAYSHGDFVSAERATVHRFRGTYGSPAAQQVTLEPQACVARWADGALEMWSATQSPSRVAAEVARVFGLPADRVRLHVPPLGGGYGAKNHAKLEPLTAALAALAERPVRLVNQRSEEFVTTTKHPARVSIETGLDLDGRFTFRRASIRWSAGAYAHSSPAVMRAGLLAVCGPYQVPAASVESVMAYTNLPPAGSFRGLGANQAVWAGERQIDEIARALAIDPLELRRRNLVRPGDRLPTGERVDGAHWVECLEAVATSLGGAEPSEPVTASRPDRRIGTGIAVAMKHTMTPSRSEAVVAALPDGMVEIRSSLVDMGQGLPGVLAHAGAHTLGLPFDRIRVLAPDTALTPFDATTSSSRGTSSGSRAVREAATALIAALRDAAAQQLGVPADALRYEAGSILSVAPGLDVSARVGAGPGLDLGAIVTISGQPELTGVGVAVNEPAIDPETGIPVSSSHWHQGAVGVRVEVDPATGVVEVTEAHGAAWAGEVLNARGARLQNEGNVIFGLGASLFERLAFTDGQPDQTSLFDYRIPSIGDIPARLWTAALEALPDGDAEATGLGESLIPAVAPAIAAAIADAVGVEPRGLPMDPPTLLAAIGATAAHSPDPSAASERAVLGPRHVAPLAMGSLPTTGELVSISLDVDGQVVRLDVPPLEPLQSVLSDRLGIRTVRGACGVGVCGSCTVTVDGVAIRSCLRPAGLCDGMTIATASGAPPDDPLLAAFEASGAAQCGFCIPGMIVAARAVLEAAPDADDTTILHGLAGNLCRCGTYGRILDAVRLAAGRDPR